MNGDLLPWILVVFGLALGSVGLDGSARRRERRELEEWRRKVNDDAAVSAQHHVYRDED